MPLLENTHAPNFSLKDKDGKTHRLTDYKNKIIVLYFYPKDNTPGCTIEAQEFTKSLEQFDKFGAVIIGISGGDELTKSKFCKKYDINVTLLSDTDFEISKKYQVYNQKSFLGKKFMGINRITFIIKDAKIIKVYNKVYPPNHAKEILEFMKELLH